MNRPNHQNRHTDSPAIALLVLPAGYPPDDHWVRSVREAVPPIMRVIVPKIPAGATAAEVVLSALPGVTEDYLFLLRAGDELLREGFAECMSMVRMQPNIHTSVVGSYHVRSDHTSFGGLVRELSAFPAGIPLEEFLLADIERPFTVPLSGVVIPVSTLRRFRRVLKLFSRSPRWGSLAVALPGTEFIRQCSKPLVSIHLEELRGREGGNGKHRDRWFQVVPSLYCVNDIVADRLLTEICEELRVNRDIKGTVQVLALLGRSLFWPEGKRLARSVLSIWKWMGRRIGTPRNGGER